MDAVTRVSYYFPTHALTAFWVISNLMVNNRPECSPGIQKLVTALLVIFCLIVFFMAFTDTYTATDGEKYGVFILPFYGPICLWLPTDADKDRVWEGFYLKVRDYVHAFLSMTAFVLVALFCNPVCMCLYPSGEDDGTSRFDAVVIRTVPITVAIIMLLIMICLGPPRQMIGLGNVPETVTAPAVSMAPDNPMYAPSFRTAKDVGSLPDDYGMEGGFTDDASEPQRDVSASYNQGGGGGFYKQPSRSHYSVNNNGKLPFSVSSRAMDQGGDRAPVRDNGASQRFSPRQPGGGGGQGGYDQGYRGQPEPRGGSPYHGEGDV